nr:hypothetical protein Iba_chr10eCG2910 [Ipomoea batatas]
MRDGARREWCWGWGAAIRRRRGLHGMMTCAAPETGSSFTAPGWSSRRTRRWSSWFTSPETENLQATKVPEIEPQRNFYPRSGKTNFRESLEPLGFGFKPQLFSGPFPIPHVKSEIRNQPSERTGRKRIKRIQKEEQENLRTIASEDGDEQVSVRPMSEGSPGPSHR